MEGSVARWYERTTRKDANEFRREAAQFAEMLPTGGEVLEVAPGPGFLSIEMAKAGNLRVTGLDISNTFVELARRNAASAGVRVDFRHGNASQMPFEEGSFDFLVCRAAFKNFTDPAGALREMRRVLKPGRKGVIIDLRRDVSMREITRYVDGLHLNPVSRLMTLLTFRFMLLRRAYTREQFEAMLKQVPFAETRIDLNPIGMEIWFER
ncbi:MAG: methyltransferase domain-containing protein [Acidobacteriaceae bacterium]